VNKDPGYGYPVFIFLRAVVRRLKILNLQWSSIPSGGVMRRVQINAKNDNVSV
jgi:hypothetical protein